MAIRKAFSGDEAVGRSCPCSKACPWSPRPAGRVGSRSDRGPQTGVPELHLFGAGGAAGRRDQFGSGFLRASGSWCATSAISSSTPSAPTPSSRRPGGGSSTFREATHRAEPAAGPSGPPPTSRPAAPSRRRSRPSSGRRSDLANTQRGVLSQTGIWADPASSAGSDAHQPVAGRPDLDLTSFQDMALQAAGHTGRIPPTIRSSSRPATTRRPRPSTGSVGGTRRARSGRSRSTSRTRLRYRKFRRCRPDGFPYGRRRPVRARPSRLPARRSWAREAPACPTPSPRAA